MRERLTSSVALGLLLALVVGTWWAADYAQRAIPIDPPRRLTHEMDAFIDRFVMVRIDEQGFAEARLEGPRAVHYPDDDSYEIVTPRAVSQRPDRSVTVATARMAVMDQSGDRIRLVGNVRLDRHNDDDSPDLRIETPELTLLTEHDIAFTDEPALITRADGSRMSGVGMHYNNQSRVLRVHADSHVTIMPRAPAPEPVPATLPGSL